MTAPLSRRDALRLAAAGLAAGASSHGSPAADAPGSPEPGVPPRPLLTPGKDFEDVSRGDPVPHTLTGDALVRARLTPETWRLEVVAEDKAKVDKPLTLADGTALDLPTLLKLGEKHGVRFLKAMQCNNIPRPLGQGLWEGVPLREVLKLCGPLDNARRVYFWGYHNDKPAQMFRSSLAVGQVQDAPPGELPPFVAYRLNGGPIPLTRGGPVRMVVPWAHGFKSIKWLQKVVLTNKYEANDTYATQNNDPESYLKTAAYFDDDKDATYPAGKPVVVRGTCMVGWPGLERVEFWLRPDAGTKGRLAPDDPAWAAATWKPAAVDPPPKDWGGGLPDGVPPKDVWGFGPDGKPKDWPLRYSIAHWSLRLADLPPGRYELRVRTVDKNGFAQPEPRPGQRSGKNLVPCKLFAVG
ncbi:MAG: molybdopterin-dependent oxidoreductase [Gemmataceae bacterium]|nr:molybdopterin-dependent oxidoreductase [Gemmataceae bacterium]